MVEAWKTFVKRWLQAGRKEWGKIVDGQWWIRRKGPRDRIAV